MHVCVCICTYRRPDLLGRLLRELARQETRDLFTYSVVVVDNDREESANPVVVAAKNDGFPVPIVYCVEAEQSIARARNRAVANARGDFIAFIDDDELPIKDWLLALFTACKELDKVTFAREDVRREAGRFLAVKVDATNDEDPVVSSTMSDYKVVGLPTVLVFDSKGNEAIRYTDFVEPDQFLTAIKKVN